MNEAKMRQACEKLQWSIDDIDWEAPGRPSVDVAKNFEPFLINVSWIEYLAEPIFIPLSNMAPTEDLRRIYHTFQLDEKRHGAAEMAIMRRWGLLKPGELPEPTYSLDLLRNLASQKWDKMHPSVLTAVIAFFEIMLDGGLIPFFAHKVKDPIFHEVFNKINADEGRHLTVGYHMMSYYGDKFTMYMHMKELLRAASDIHILYGVVFGLLAFLGNTWQSLDSAGLDIRYLKNMIDKYIQLGAEDVNIARNPIFKIMKTYGEHLKYGEFHLEGYLNRLSDTVASFEKGYSRLATIWN